VGSNANVEAFRTFESLLRRQYMRKTREILVAVLVVLARARVCGDEDHGPLNIRWIARVL